VDSHELLDMFHQEHKDRLAKHLRRTGPLLDNSLDEALLNYERVATRKLSRASSSAIKYGNQEKAEVTGKVRNLLMSTLEHFVDVDFMFLSCHFRLPLGFE
jgi:hypothetical protein